MQGLKQNCLSNCQNQLTVYRSVTLKYLWTMVVLTMYTCFFFQSKPICGLNQLVCDCRLVGAVVLCLGGGSLVVDSLFIVLLVFVVVDFVVVLVL